MAGVMSMPVNMAKLLREQLAAQTALINTNADSNATEVNTNVDAEALTTRSNVANELTTVNNTLGQSEQAINALSDKVDTNLQSINAHTSAAVAGISLDMYAGAAGAGNVVSSVGSFNYTELGAGDTGVRSSRFFRTGSGVITRLYKMKNQAIEMWVDGELFLELPRESTPGGANIIGYNADLMYIKYEKSIEIFVTNDFGNKLSSRLNHVMTG